MHELTLPDGSTASARALAYYRLTGGRIVVNDVMFDPDLMPVLGTAHGTARLSSVRRQAVAESGGTEVKNLGRDVEDSEQTVAGALDDATTREDVEAGGMPRVSSADNARRM